MDKIILKNKEEQKIVIEGGKRLSEIKHGLLEKVKVGVSAWEIEELAVELTKRSGGEVSFAKVPGYRWATCINVNEGIVHGIPKKEVVFQKGDIVSVDVGLFYEGFNTDTSFSVGLDVDSETQKFLNVGKDTLDKAIAKVVKGNHIYDISEVIERNLRDNNYNPVRALVGHGVGRQLHEGPQIPQFIVDKRVQTPEIVVGSVLAVEIIYSTGSGEIKHASDGWTIVTKDGKISALYEDTICVTENGSLNVTR